MITKNFLFYFSFSFLSALYSFFIVGTEIPVIHPIAKEFCYSFLKNDPEFEQKYMNDEDKIMAKNYVGNYITLYLYPNIEEVKYNIKEKSYTAYPLAYQPTVGSSCTYYIKNVNGISKLTVYETDDGNFEPIDSSDIMLYKTLMSAHYLRCYISEEEIDLQITRVSYNVINPLPNDMLNHILCHLDTKSLISMKCASKGLNQAINVPPLIFTINRIGSFYVTDIIKQICSGNYNETCSILPSSIFKSPFILEHLEQDRSWAMDLFLNFKGACRFQLNDPYIDDPYITYIHEKEYNFDVTEYTLLVNACFTKKVADLAIKYYESTKNETILDWHIKNNIDNNTELEKWYGPDELNVNINNNNFTVYGVSSYKTCFKWLWESIKYNSEIDEYGESNKTREYNVFYSKEETLFALAKLLMNDATDGIISNKDKKRYITEMENFYKPILHDKTVDLTLKAIFQEKEVPVEVQEVPIEEVPVEEVPVQVEIPVKVPVKEEKKKVTAEPAAAKEKEKAVTVEKVHEKPSLDSVHPAAVTVEKAQENPAAVEPEPAPERAAVPVEVIRITLILLTKYSYDQKYSSVPAEKVQENPAAVEPAAKEKEKEVTVKVITPVPNKNPNKGKNNSYLVTRSIVVLIAFVLLTKYNYHQKYKKQSSFYWTKAI